MELAEKLRAISAEVRKRRRFATNEASTRNYLIDPFIRALGYDPNEPNDVEPEFTADFVAGNRKVDYALKKEGKPTIFVEFKTATKNLSFEHTVQLQHYFSTKLDVRFGIVTNGLEYRFFADIDNPNVMDDEPFLIVDMLNWDERMLHDVAEFSQSDFVFESALSTARQLKYGDVIRQRIESEMEQPSREIIRYLARDLYAGSMSNAVVQEFAPIIRRAWHQIVREENTDLADYETTAKAESPAVEPIAFRDRIHPYVPPSTLPTDSDIVEIPIYAWYGRKKIYETVLYFDKSNNHRRSRIMYAGKKQSLSKAGEKLLEDRGVKRLSVGGWKDIWRLDHPFTNKQCPLDVLRKDPNLAVHFADKS